MSNIISVTVLKGRVKHNKKLFTAGQTFTGLTDKEARILEEQGQIKILSLQVPGSPGVKTTKAPTPEDIDSSAPEDIDSSAPDVEDQDSGDPLAGGFTGDDFVPAAPAKSKKQ